MFRTVLDVIQLILLQSLTHDARLDIYILLLLLRGWICAALWKYKTEGHQKKFNKESLEFYEG